MPRAIKAFFNLIFIFLISISAIIVYSENSEDLKTKITSLVQSEIKKSFDVNASIKSLDVKWVGFEPVIQMKNIYMNSILNQVLVNLEKSMQLLD